MEIVAMSMQKKINNFSNSQINTNKTKNFFNVFFEVIKT